MPGNRSFSHKLTVLIVIVICVPLLTLSAVAAVGLHRNIDENNRALNTRNLESMAAFLNVYFDRYRQLTDAMFISEGIQEVAQTNPETRADMLICNRLFSSEIQRITINSFDVDGVYLFCKNGAEYTYYTGQYTADIRRRYQLFVQEQPEPTHSRLYADGFFPNESILDGTSGYKILLMRPIFNYKTREYLGVIVLEFTHTLFQELLGYSQDITFLADREGVIVYDSTGSNLKESADSLWAGGGGSARVTYRGRGYTKTDILTQYDWRIIQLVDYSGVNGIFYRSLLPILVITLISAAVFLCLAVAMSKRLVAPIKTLEAAMEKASRGDLTHHVDIQTRDELEHLGASYNSMLDQLNLHIETAYNQAIYRLDAEYRALQSQINPHFLYNTLEYINSMAQINGQTGISRMICALADLFRYTTRHSDKLVPLGQEILHVQNYIRLQSIADEKPIQVVLDIPEAMQALQVPKLILQPLVENVFIHAFEAADSAHRLTISGGAAGEGFAVDVADNGKGILPERLEKLRADLESGAETAALSSIGLANIHKRLGLTLGNHSGLRIESTPAAGTRVTIMIGKQSEA